MCEIANLNFFALGLNVEDSHSAHFIDDGTKVKIPSRLKPRLSFKKNVKDTFPGNSSILS